MRPLVPVLLLSFLALPLSAEVRGAARAGFFEGSGESAVGTLELDIRQGAWSLAPAIDFIHGGYGLYAVHADVRRIFPSQNRTFWVGAGPTVVKSNSPSSQTTWNLDAGVSWRLKSGWEPFVAARYYRFRMPVFRDRLEGNGAVISVGISRRFL